MATISPASRGRTVHVLKATGHVKHGGDAVILLLAMLYHGRLDANLQTRPVTWTLRTSYLSSCRIPTLPNNVHFLDSKYAIRQLSQLRLALAL